MTTPPRTAAPSWQTETIQEHIGTLATLHNIADWYEQQGEHDHMFQVRGNALKCMDDLYEELNRQGLRSVTTMTHTATLMADGSVRVVRREDV